MLKYIALALFLTTITASILAVPGSKDFRGGDCITQKDDVSLEKWEKQEKQVYLVMEIGNAKYKLWDMDTYQNAWGTKDLMNQRFMVITCPLNRRGR